VKTVNLKETYKFHVEDSERQPKMKKDIQSW